MKTFFNRVDGLPSPHFSENPALGLIYPERDYFALVSVQEAATLYERMGRELSLAVLTIRYKIEAKNRQGVIVETPEFEANDMGTYKLDYFTKENSAGHVARLYFSGMVSEAESLLTSQGFFKENRTKTIIYIYAQGNIYRLKIDGQNAENFYNFFEYESTSPFVKASLVFKNGVFVVEFKNIPGSLETLTGDEKVFWLYDHLEPEGELPF